MSDAIVGSVLTTADPEPPVGTIVLCLGEKWGNLGDYWVAMDRDGQESWNKIAGNYGPVTVLAVGRTRRCAPEACDEYDGIHSYGDGCAMAVEREPKVPAEVIDALYWAGRRMLDIELAMVGAPSPFRDRAPARKPSPGCYTASWGMVHSRPSCRCPR